MSETLRGVVKWFNDAKGFGFIEHTSGRDVFVHFSVIQSDGFKTLKDGEQVEYEIKEGPKGLHAMRVAKVPGQDDAAEAGAPAASAASGGEDSEDQDQEDSDDDSDNQEDSSGQELN